MIRTRLALSVTLICALAAGCRNRRAPSLGMSDSTFVGALRELRRVQADSSLDTTMRDSSRRMILRRYSVTSAQLEHAARVLAESPARASDLWRQIESASRPAVARPNTPIPGPPPSNNHPVPRP
jgi:crotonobetainyl-CoA:carnitine CoA-transferase CaiB-like acyl-CoA transferase